MAEFDGVLNLIRSFAFTKTSSSMMFYEVMGRLPRLNEKFSFAYTFLNAEGMMPKIERSSTKSTAKAVAFKSLGDVNFARGELVEALKLYTKCAAVALPDSAELAFAYANRSATLYKLKRYEACLVDLNRALQENYPEASKPKLRDRKKSCWSKLCERNSSMLNHLKSIEHQSLDDDTLHTNMKHAMEKCEFDVDATDMNYDNKFYLPEVNFKNEIIPNASEKIKIEFNSKFGRHIVATQDIKIGEILAIEKPYSLFLHLNRRYSHCANCSVRCESLIPCLNCSMVMFCSKRCRKNALDRFHRIECETFSFEPNLFDGEQFMKCMRLLMMATKQGEALETMMKHPVHKNPFEKVLGDVCEKFDPNDYTNIHNLEDNFDKQSDDGTLNTKIQMLIVLIYILKHTSFFNEPSNRDMLNLSEKEKYVGSLLLKFMYLSDCNAFQTTERFENSGSNASKNITMGEKIGSSIYSFHSLFNHACNGNVYRSFHKDTIVTRAIESVKAGEQLFMNYGSPYQYFPRSHRQQTLLQRSFQCRCVPCQNNWPMAENFPSVKREISRSKNLNNRAIKMRKWNSSLQNQFNGKLSDFLCEYLTLLGKYTKLPNQEHHECRQQLENMFMARGNYYSSDDNILMLL